MAQANDLTVFITTGTAIRLTVIAQVRHAETTYDMLLVQGYDRADARASVERTVDRVLGKWQAPPGHRGKPYEPTFRSPADRLRRRAWGRARRDRRVAK